MLPRPNAASTLVASIAAVLVLASGASAQAVVGGGAVADGTGGGSAPAAASSSGGGTQFGAVVAKRPPVVRPVATLLGVRGPLTEGATPHIVARFDEPGVRTVRARVVVLRVPGNTPVARIDMGSVATGHSVAVAWPRGTSLAAGQYLVRVHAHDHFNHQLARLAHASGRATLVVRPRATPAPATAPAPAPAPLAPVSPGGLFPVVGPYTFGDRFGVTRPGHSHQGQDVSAAEGTPIVAPQAGTITSSSYQASAAGYYVVEQAADGRAFFFAHCQKGSVAVEEGQAVATGASICRVGHTGDATGPHLHFEIWLGGWRTGSASHTVDPLPQLQAWAR